MPDLRPIDNWIELHSGKKFNPASFSGFNVKLDDIFVVLPRLCRYNGHTKRFYSVAEHCILMAEYVAKQSWATPRDVLVALHHDDAEYVLSDLVRPIKQDMPEFKIMEQLVEKVVFGALGLPTTLPNWLHTLDLQILVDERKHVINPSSNTWAIDGQPGLGVKPWKFMWRFESYVRWRFKRMHYKWMKRYADQLRQLAEGVDPNSELLKASTY